MNCVQISVRTDVSLDLLQGVTTKYALAVNGARDEKGDESKESSGGSPAVGSEYKKKENRELHGA